MTGKTHAICGVSTAIAITLCAQQFEVYGITVYPIVGVLTAATGSYFPDIDIAQSKFGRKHPWLAKHLTHRGPLTHSLLLTAISILLMFLLGLVPLVPSIIFGFGLGCFTHVIADLFNKKGVPLLWPLIRVNIHLACVKTASKVQQVIFIICWEVVLLCLVLWRWGILQYLLSLVQSA